MRGGGVAAAVGPVPVDQEEQHGGDVGGRGERLLEAGDARGPGGGHPGGGEDDTDGGADEVGEGDEADGRGTLPLGEPAGGEGGPGVEEQRLGDGDRDGPGKGEAVVRAGERADGRSPGHEHPAQAYGDEHAAGVDEPRRPQRERQERQHEHHGQHPDGEPVHAVVRLRRGEDRGVADPQGLDHEVQATEHREHREAVGRGGRDLCRGAPRHAGSITVLGICGAQSDRFFRISLIVSKNVEQQGLP